jgi:hypothetical protein
MPPTGSISPLLSRAWPAPPQILSRGGGAVGPGVFWGLGGAIPRDQSLRWYAALAQKNEAPSFTPDDCPLI